MKQLWPLGRTLNFIVNARAGHCVLKVDAQLILYLDNLSAQVAIFYCMPNSDEYISILQPNRIYCKLQTFNSQVFLFTNIKQRQFLNSTEESSQEIIYPLHNWQQSVFLETGQLKG